jgi:hypothetical protein
MGIKYSEQYMVLKYRDTLHIYIQSKMDFIDISSQGVSYQYVVKIKHKFRHQNKREFIFANLKQVKYGKDGPNNQPPDNQSKPQENKGNVKMKDTGKWCNFHKILW